MFIENNRAKIEITGLRQDVPGKLVYRVDADNFTNILLELIEYSRDCLIAHNAGRAFEYTGAGSESGKWLDRSLQPWRLASSESLLLAEKRLLEGIIGMHNQVYECSKGTVFLG